MRFLLGLCILFSLTIYSLPYIIKDQTLIWLKNQGISAPKLQDVSIQWLAGTFVIQGLKATKPGAVPLEINQLSISINYSALFEQQLLIETILVSGVNTGITQQADKFSLGPIDLNQFQSDAPKTDTASHFKFGLKSLQLSDIDFSLQMQKHQQQLHIDSAAIDDFYQWNLDQSTTLTLLGSVNGAPLKISSVSAPLSVQKKSSLSVTLQDFPIQSITAPFVPGLSAMLSLDFNLDFIADDITNVLNHRGKFTLSALKAQHDQQQLTLDNMDWIGSGQLILSKEKILYSSKKGKIALQDVTLFTKEEPQLSLKRLDWQGPLGISFNAGKIEKLSITEQLTLSELVLHSPLSLSIAKLAVTDTQQPLQLNFKDNAIANINLSSSIELDQLTLSDKAFSASLQHLTLENSQPLTLSFKQGQLHTLTAKPSLQTSSLAFTQDGFKALINTLSLDGPLQISNLGSSALLTGDNNIKSSGLEIQKDNLTINVKTLAIRSKTNNMDLSQPSIDRVDIELEQLSVTDTATSLTLISAATLALNNAIYSATGLSLDSAKVQQLVIAKTEGAAALASTQTLSIDRLALIDNQRLNINQISIDNSSHRIHISEDGKVKLLAQLQQSFTGTNSVSEPPTNSAKKFHFNINKIKLSGDNIIDFEDQSVDPWFKSNINFSKVVISDLDSGSSKMSPIQITAKVNDSATLDLEGKYALFANNAQGQWQLNINDLSLPVISPYAGRAAGYFLDSGKLTLNSSGTISNGVIKGKNKIVIQQLAVRSAQSKATKNTNKSLNMPLDLAIALLEDAQGNINLSVPVAGSVDDPNFGYSSIVQIIAKKGMKKAAFGLLTKALQPYGALLTVANTLIDARESGTFINLAPIGFQPGEAQINADMQGYLKKLATMMNTRKKLKLKLCGSAVTTDKNLLSLAALKENVALKAPLDAVAVDKNITNQLQVLATSRGEAVKKSLIKLQVNTDRLFLCFAKVSLKNPKAIPNVSLGL